MKLKIGIINATAAAIGRIQEQVGKLLVITDFNKDTQLFSAILELESPSEDGVSGQVEALTILGEGLSEEAQKKELNPLELILYKPINDLEISIRTKLALRNKNGIRVVGDLVMRTEAEYLKLQDVGRKSLMDVKDALADLGLCFGMKLENYPDPEIMKKLDGDSQQ